MADRKTTLFIRISLRLIFPLILLISSFAAIQLTNQLLFLNKVYEIQSRASLQAITQRLIRVLHEPGNFENPRLLDTEVKRAQEAYGASEVLLFDPLTREVLFSKQGEFFSSSDLLAAEGSLLAKKEGKPPLLEIDKQSQKLNAFIPVTSSVL